MRRHINVWIIFTQISPSCKRDAVNVTVWNTQLATFLVFSCTTSTLERSGSNLLRPCCMDGLRSEWVIVVTHLSLATIVMQCNIWLTNRRTEVRVSEWWGTSDRSSCGIPSMPVVYQVVGFGRGDGRHSDRHRRSEKWRYLGGHV